MNSGTRPPAFVSVFPAASFSFGTLTLHPYFSVASMLPADQMEKTQQRLDGFKAGHGTILFFDDESVIRQQQEAFKLYADNFPIWANQSNVRVTVV